MSQRGGVFGPGAVRPKLEEPSMRFKYSRVQVRPKKRVRVPVLRLGENQQKKRRCQFLKGLQGGLRWSVGMISKVGSAYLHLLLLVSYQGCAPKDDQECSLTASPATTSSSSSSSSSSLKAMFLRSSPSSSPSSSSPASPFASIWNRPAPNLKD